jgi:CBS domain containing-hemolysin-like protein
MLSQLGHIPCPGETTSSHGYEFRVQAMRRRRIQRIRVMAPVPKAEAEAGDGEQGAAGTHTT